MYTQALIEVSFDFSDFFHDLTAGLDSCVWWTFTSKQTNRITGVFFNAIIKILRVVYHEKCSQCKRSTVSYKYNGKNFSKITVFIQKFIKTSIINNGNANINFTADCHKSGGARYPLTRKLKTLFSKQTFNHTKRRIKIDFLRKIWFYSILGY